MSVIQVAFLQFNREYYPVDQSNKQLKIQLKQHLESMLILRECRKGLNLVSHWGILINQSLTTDNIKHTTWLVFFFHFGPQLETIGDKM